MPDPVDEQLKMPANVASALLGASVGRALGLRPDDERVAEIVYYAWLFCERVRHMDRCPGCEHCATLDRDGLKRMLTAHGGDLPPCLRRRPALDHGWVVLCFLPRNHAEGEHRALCSEGLTTW